MPRLRQRDIDAMRIGIKEQARSEIAQEDWEHTLRKVEREPGIYPPQGVELVQACQLVPGDILAGSNWGYDFRELGEVQEVRAATLDGGPIAGDLLLVISNGNSRALKKSDTVLRKYRYQRPDGSS